MVRNLFKLLSVLAVILVGTITVMVTYQTLIGLAVFTGLIASATAPFSLSLIIAFWAITLLVSMATMIQSAPGIRRAFSNWGQYIDNKILEWWTGKKYYIDEARNLLNKGEILLHSAADDISKAYEERNLKKNKVQIDKVTEVTKTLGGPIIIDDPYKEWTTYTKIFIAGKMIDHARDMLVINDVQDQQESEADKQLGKRARKAKLKKIQLDKANEKLEKVKFANQPSMQ